MTSSPSPDGTSAYLESLMRAGQQSVKQFDDAMASAMGIESKPPAREPWPFAFTTNMQRQFWSPVTDFWKGFLGDASAEGSRRSGLERRFQDEAWQHSPYYELVKQLAEFVDEAQVDEKSKLQLRFYAGNSLMR